MFSHHPCDLQLCQQGLTLLNNEKVDLGDLFTHFWDTLYAMLQRRERNLLGFSLKYCFYSEFTLQLNLLSLG